MHVRKPAFHCSICAFENLALILVPKWELSSWGRPDPNCGHCTLKNLTLSSFKTLVPQVQFYSEKRLCKSGIVEDIMSIVS